MLQDRGRRTVGQRALRAGCVLLAGLLQAGLLLAWTAGLGRAQASGLSILESEDPPFRYLLTLSGTVGQETFSGVPAILTLAHAPAESGKQYAVVITGMPNGALRNTLYWNSEDGPMEDTGGTIHSRLVGRGLKPGQAHFFYFSPALLAGIPLTQHSGADRKIVEDRVAKPLKVMAQSGDLTLNVSKSRITGRIRMYGQDPLSHDYVVYAATIAGQRQPWQHAE